MKLADLKKELDLSPESIRSYEELYLGIKERPGEQENSADREIPDEEAGELKKCWILRKIGLVNDEIVLVRTGSASLHDAVAAAVRRTGSKRHEYVGALNVSRDLYRENFTYATIDTERFCAMIRDEELMEHGFHIAGSDKKAYRAMLMQTTGMSFLSKGGSGTKLVQVGLIALIVGAGANLSLNGRAGGSARTTALITSAVYAAVLLAVLYGSWKLIEKHPRKTKPIARIAIVLALALMVAFFLLALYWSKRAGA